ncbi:MAG: hypothetical protein QXL57_00970 [Candidatus Bathyarchaeia archaeon]
MNKKLVIALILMTFIWLIHLSLLNQVKAQTSTISIINPGPASKPAKWTAAPPPPGEIGGPSFTFYAPQTALESTFFINLTIENAVNIRSWGIGLVYENASIAYVSAWRPTDHIFAPAESGGATPIVPSVTLEGINTTHTILKWGYAYLWKDEEGNPIRWGFNGSGVLCQIQFKLVKAVDSGQWTTVLALDPEWTQVYPFDMPPETPNVEPGYVTYIYDDTPPLIQNVTQTPPANNVQPNEPVIVSANVTDDNGVKSVILNYTIDNGETWTSVAMTYNEDSGLYEGTIPGQAAGTNVKYQIHAEDNAGNIATNDNEGEYFPYIVIPELTIAAIVLLLTFVSLFIIIAAKRNKRPVIRA